jgi:plasmid replication initiation protein
MELMDVNKENKLIYQHNVITSGRYDYSACMLDILFMVLSGLEVGKMEYTIHVQDIEAITGRKWNLKQLREATESIGSRMFEIETPERIRQIWLFSNVDYILGTGSFTVGINPKASPYFFELKNNFTAMQLKSVLNCSSKYAKRLYAIACQWRSVGSKRFEIEELKKMLGLIDKKGNEQFERISDFKIKVLDVAKKQINENTDIEIDFELKKRGRSFHWITLHINSQKFKQLEIEFDKSIDIQKFKSKLMAYGFNEEQAELIATQEKEKDFDILITELNEKVRSRKLAVNKSIAYLVGIYQKKGILIEKN